MAELVIEGGAPLHGTLHVSGAKNAALPIMAAALLTSEPLRLRHMPRTTDIETLIVVLRHLGVQADWVGEDALNLQVTDTSHCAVPDQCVQAMRASICVLGPLLAQRGAAHLLKPGGCKIGERPVDVHLKGLRALGARLVEDPEVITASARSLTGAEVDLAVSSGSSVLGTANVLCAASLARGRTVIHHAACEPEICELAHLINLMGGRVFGIGTPTIEVEGVRELHGAEFEILPDRIEAGTFLVAGAITGGDVFVEGAQPGPLAPVLRVFEQMGVALAIEPGGIRVRGNGRLRPAQFVTEPHPGFPTDMQAQVMALMCLAEGRSTVTEKIFPSRFKHVPELQRMGANIHQDGARVEVTGVSQLNGASVTASDLRASAALVVAGLAAQGTTVIREVEHLDRGYAAMEEKLKGAGARIRREVG